MSEIFESPGEVSAVRPGSKKSQQQNNVRDLSRAVAALHHCYLILNADPDHHRHAWKRRIAESRRFLLRRRRAWLEEAGVDLYLCMREWDDLSDGVREKLKGVRDGF